MARLAGRRIIVTGASRGIGRAMALLFAAEGARVAAVARGAAALQEAAAAVAGFPGQVFPLAADVTDAAAVAGVVARVVEAWGGLDVLVNNAGVGVFAPVAELSEAAWDEMMGVNLKGPFLMARAALEIAAAPDGVILNQVVMRPVVPPEFQK